MKKLALAAVLAAAVSTASAGVTVFGTYDYDRVNSSGSYTEANIGAALNTKLGTFDASIVGARINAGAYDDALGFEVGYTNGLKLGAVGLKGRVGYGRLNQVDTVARGFTGANTEYYSLAAEAGLPLTQSVSAFVGYRHRNGLDAETPAAQNRYTAGIDVKLSPSLAVRLGAAHTRQAGAEASGVTTAVSFKF